LQKWLSIYQIAFSTALKTCNPSKDVWMLRDVNAIDLIELAVAALGQWRKLYLELLDRQLLHAYRPLGIDRGELRQSANSSRSILSPH
jgi:hypothetical protein